MIPRMFATAHSRTFLSLHVIGLVVSFSREPNQSEQSVVHGEYGSACIG